MLIMAIITQIIIVLTSINIIDALKLACRHGISKGESNLKTPYMHVPCIKKCIVTFTNNADDSLDTWTHGCDTLNVCGSGKQHCCCDTDDCNDKEFARKCAAVNSASIEVICGGVLLVISAIAMFLCSH